MIFPPIYLNSINAMFWDWIDWSWYALAMLAFAITAIYAQIEFQTSLTEIEKKRALSLKRGALESLVYGFIVAGALFYVSWLIGDPDLSYAAQKYDELAEHMQYYVISLGTIAAQLQITIVLSPLVSVWLAMSWLTNTAAQSLLFLFASFNALAKIVKDWGPILLSIGVAMVGIERLRRLGGVLCSSIPMLAIYLGWSYKVSYVESILNANLTLGNVLLVGPILEMLWGTVLSHARLFVEAVVFYSFTFSLALIAAAGFSYAIGGLATYISARI